MMDQAKKKLLIVTSTFPRYEGDVSSARFVLDLAKVLAIYYEVHVLAPHSPSARREETVEGVKVYRFRYFFPTGLERLTREAGIMANLKKNKILFFQLPFLFVSEIFNIVRIVRREQIDIVNSHWMVPQGLAVALVKNCLKVKHVLTIHAADIFALKRWGGIGKKISRYIVGRTDIALPVSGYIKETLDSLVSINYGYDILPMGVAEERFPAGEKSMALRTEELRLLFVGKLVEKKGLIYILEAVKALKEKGIPVKLTVAGSGPLEESLKKYVNEEELDSGVIFCGWTPNDRLSELYSRSDVTVVPSVYDKNGETEGMPVVVLESMATGTPVLASRISGMPDIVVDDRNGWLVDPGSSVAISERLEQIISMDLSEYSKEAISTAAKYTCSSIAARYRDKIEELFN